MNDAISYLTALENMSEDDMTSEQKLLRHIYNLYMSECDKNYTLQSKIDLLYMLLDELKNAMKYMVNRKITL